MTQYDPTNFNLTIKSVKCAGGEETPRFELNLYINNKKAAQVSNGGTGGQCAWYWENKEIESLFNQHLKHLASLGKFKLSSKQIEQLGIDPSDTNLIDSMAEMSSEQGDELIYQMLDEFEENKQLKSWCKTQTIYTLKDSKLGAYGRVKAKYSPQVKQFLIDKYGNRLSEIINERFVK